MEYKDFALTRNPQEMFKAVNIHVSTKFANADRDTKKAIGDSIKGHCMVIRDACAYHLLDEADEPDETAAPVLSQFIPARFDETFFHELWTFIKFQGGINRAEQWLLSQKYHPSFVKAAIKKIMATRGW